MTVEKKKRSMFTLRSCRKVRFEISEKISQVLGKNNVYYQLEVPAKKQTAEPVFEWILSEKNDDLLRSIPKVSFDSAYVQNVRITAESSNTKVEFKIEPQAYLESLLLPIEETKQSPSCEEHTVIEFSSPNIAKPFHVGHLRSTIIGNVLGNLHQQIGHKVTKINYLGDWGTQFGMLQVGVELIGVTEEQMQRKPIETLYQAYVAANTAAKTNSSIFDRARHYFTDLENAQNTRLAKQWDKYRKYTINELEQMYARLGVQFDKYEWESQYSQKEVGAILKRLEQKSLLYDEPDGRKVVEVDGRRVPIIKSDGSTLYLARDIAALVDRFRRLRFTRILYVVENGQADHFNACFKTTAALCENIDLKSLIHVKFGRIHGMSTRSGNVVFLRDVLDEARDIMLEKQLNSTTTKVDILSNESNQSKSVADVLGVSAVTINDLKQRRQRDYNFDWNKALQVNGDTGIKLQYTHCRLYSLLENMSHINVENVKPTIKHLMEPEAQDVLYELARFEQTVWLASQKLEACVLVNYLFSLCNATSRALKCLKVKNEACLEKQQNRILLFRAAKSTLKQGMEILGLKTLNQM